MATIGTTLDISNDQDPELNQLQNYRPNILKSQILGSYWMRTTQAQWELHLIFWMIWILNRSNCGTTGQKNLRLKFWDFNVFELHRCIWNYSGYTNCRTTCQTFLILKFWVFAECLLHRRNWNYTGVPAWSGSWCFMFWISLVSFIRSKISFCNHWIS